MFLYLCVNHIINFVILVEYIYVDVILYMCQIVFHSNIVEQPMTVQDPSSTIFCLCILTFLCFYTNQLKIKPQKNDNCTFSTSNLNTLDVFSSLPPI